MTKAEIIEKLTEAGVEFDGSANKADLEALLPVEVPAIEEPLPETLQDEPVGDRGARWVAFLAKAKEQNPVKFSVKEKAGEFKVIPDTFR